jgi:hypothetical protein
MKVTVRRRESATRATRSGTDGEAVGSGTDVEAVTELRATPVPGRGVEPATEQMAMALTRSGVVPVAESGTGLVAEAGTMPVAGVESAASVGGAPTEGCTSGVVFAGLQDVVAAVEGGVVGLPVLSAAPGVGADGLPTVGAGPRAGAVGTAVFTGPEEGAAWLPVVVAERVVAGSAAGSLPLSGASRASSAATVTASAGGDVAGALARNGSPNRCHPVGDQ